MSNGLFGRLARKWWVMLVIGVVIGLAAGLPAGGRLLPEKLTGQTYSQTINLRVKVGEVFMVVGRAEVNKSNSEFVTWQYTDGSNDWFKAEKQGETQIYTKYTVLGNIYYRFYYIIID